MYNHEKSVLQLEAPIPEHPSPRVFSHLERESVVICCGAAVQGKDRAAWSVFCGWGSKHNASGVLGPDSDVPLSEVGAQAYAVCKAVELARCIRQDDATLRHVYIVSSSQYVVASLTKDAHWFEESKDSGRLAANLIRDALRDIKAFGRSGRSKNARWMRMWEVPKEENKEAQSLAADALRGLSA